MNLKQLLRILEQDVFFSLIHLDVFFWVGQRIWSDFVELGWAGIALFLTTPCRRSCSIVWSNQLGDSSKKWWRFICRYIYIRVQCIYIYTCTVYIYIYIRVQCILYIHDWIVYTWFVLCLFPPILPLISLITGYEQIPPLSHGKPVS